MLFPARIVAKSKGLLAGLIRPLNIFSLCLTIVVAWIGLSNSVLAQGEAQLKWSQSNPPVFQVGTETELVAEGKFPNWPPDITCDRTDVEVTASEKAGVFKVTVENDAYPGVAWCRLYDATSTSSAMPLLVTRAQVASEVEPNDRVSEAQAVELPTVVAGKLAKNGDSDLFRFELAKDELLVATVIANEILESPMDAVLQLCDAHGNVLQQVEDTRGFDPQLIYRAPQDEVVHARLFAFPATPNSSIRYAGGSNFQYALYLTTGPYLDHALLASNEPPCREGVGFNLADGSTFSSRPPTEASPRTIYLPQAGLGWAWQRNWETQYAIPNPQVVCEPQTKSDRLPAMFLGTIDEQDEVHRLHFELTEGKTYRMDVQSRRLGFRLDSKLVLHDLETSQELASNDDLSRSEFDASLRYKATKSGTVELLIFDTLGSFSHRHSYHLLVAEEQPSFRLSVATDRFAVEVDKTVEVPVTILRSSGFSDSIEIWAEGLPDGIKMEAAVSEPKGESKGDSSKLVKLKLTASPSSSGRTSFRVVGAAKREADSRDADVLTEQTATFQRLPAVAISQLWLNVKPPPSPSP